jgi:viologen exporter family transport system permease protein
MNPLRLYFRYAGVSIRSQLQYRASFWMQTIGHFAVTGIEFGGIWALFDRFGTLRDWTLAETAMFYGLISVTFSIADAFARGFDLFGNMVKGGDFDRLLARPRSTVLQLLGQELTLRRVGRLAQGVVVLAWAITALEVDWSVLDAAVLALAVVGGVCLFTGLVILQATSAFWTTESLEVWNAFTYGGVTMSQYPIPIYRPWFRQIFTYVIPLGCVTYFPVLAVLDRPDPLGTSTLLQTLAPLAGVAFLLVALQAWKLGVRHYRSTGS